MPRTYTRFLEPAAGDGNFLVAILERKISAIDETKHGGSEQWFEFALLRCLASTYGIDINDENVEEARERMMAVIDVAHVFRGEPATEGFAGAAAAIIATNVVLGDSLNAADQIVFIEYTPVEGERFQRVPSELETPMMDLLRAASSAANCPLLGAGRLTAEVVAVVAKHLPDAHVPDVLETLAQLPNDDVYTPPKVVDAMLDILPAHVWAEPHYTWLDPATKSGIYLREVFKRLMVGLSEWEPDGQKRRGHILKNMLHGAATTPINGEIARRSLYQRMLRRPRKPRNAERKRRRSCRESPFMT